MSIASILLVLAVAILFIAIAILAWLAITEKSFSFQGIWERALAGHKLSKTYIALIGLAFVFAVVGQILNISENAKPKIRAFLYHASPDLYNV